MFSILFAVTFACSNGVAILVGQQLGSGDFSGARTCQRAGLQLAAMLTAVVSLPLLVAPGIVLRAFSPGTEVVTLAVNATWTALAAVPIMVIAMNLSGLLRAAGDTRSTMIALLIGSYLVEIPLAWLLHDSLGVIGVYLALLAYWMTRLAVTWARYRKGSWRTDLDLSGA
ncbi:MAG: MATE family efflux transporter [Pseudonocardiaceae bacterium]